MRKRIRERIGEISGEMTPFVKHIKEYQAQYQEKQRKALKSVKTSLIARITALPDSSPIKNRLLRQLNPSDPKS